jgi:putative ABC transport system permease protein
MIGDEQLYAFTLAPVDGLPEGIAPVIPRGRAPSAPDEVALGASTMARAGVDLGDTVSLRYLDRTEELVVVGEAIINDGYEERPGVGAIVHHEWVEQVDGENFASDVVVRFEPESREEGIRAMEAAFPDSAAPAQVQVSIRDLQRIDSWLTVLAAFAAALATATFAHALIVTVRRQQGQLGVLRAIGFSRRQVRSSVAWLASLVVVVAVIIGLPVGMAFGRWGWGRLADNLGVPAVSVIAPTTLVLAAVAALLLAHLIAIPVGWRAARVRPVDALRAE